MGMIELIQDVIHVYTVAPFGGIIARRSTRSPYQTPSQSQIWHKTIM